MRNKSFLATLFAITTLALGMLWTAARADAQQVQILHNFNATGAGGIDPLAGLVSDGYGDLYGTTYEGGTYGYGTVFELLPKPSGGWTAETLHAFKFTSNGADGINPKTGLAIDASGNLYGTTRGGGAYGQGTVYELARKANGSWGERILHSFNDNCQDGKDPEGGLIIDVSGHIYGTTFSGGGYCTYGTVFELAKTTGGQWVEKILYSFNNNGSDGYDPAAGLTFDANGNLYATTQYGGSYSYGTVFELVRGGHGAWAEQILHSFNADGTDGTDSYASVVFDTSGNLYGTTYYGGTFGYGTVFELSPQADGAWSEAVLHSFNQNGADGAYPRTGLVLDALGNVYGTTTGGGSHTPYGTVFELTPTSSGWAESVVLSFNHIGIDEYNPIGDLVVGPSGSLYGTTAQGGAYGGGTVYEIIP